MIFKVLRVNGKVVCEKYMDEIPDREGWTDAIFNKLDKINFPKDEILLSIKCANTQVIFIYVLTKTRREILIMYVNFDPMKESTRYHLTLSTEDSTRAAYIDMLRGSGSKTQPYDFDDMCNYVSCGPDFDETHPLYKLTKYTKDSNKFVENRVKNIYKNNGILVFHQLILDSDRIAINKDTCYSVFGILITMNTNKVITMEEIMR